MTYHRFCQVTYLRQPAAAMVGRVDRGEDEREERWKVELITIKVSVGISSFGLLWKNLSCHSKNGRKPTCGRMADNLYFHSFSLIFIFTFIFGHFHFYFHFHFWSYSLICTHLHSHLHFHIHFYFHFYFHHFNIWNQFCTFWLRVFTIRKKPEACARLFLPKNMPQSASSWYLAA